MAVSTSASRLRQTIDMPAFTRQHDPSDPGFDRDRLARIGDALRAL
jgi:hypothetical protein